MNLYDIRCNARPEPSFANTKISAEKPPTLSEIQQQSSTLLDELDGTIKNFADRLEPVLLPRQDVPAPIVPKENDCNVSSLTSFQLTLLRSLRASIDQLNTIHSRINV